MVERPYRTAAGITAVVLAILLGLWLVVLLRTLVVVLLVAAILAAAFDRPVRWIQRRLHAPRGASVLAVSLLSVAILVGVGMLVYQPFKTQSKVFSRGLPAQAERLKQLPVVGPRLRNVDLRGETQRFLADLPDKLKAHRELVLGVAQTTFTALAILGTIAVTTVFMLLKGPQLAEGATGLILDEVRRARARRLGHGMLEAVSGYVLGNLLISFLASLVVVISCLVMKVPFIPVLAVIMFIIDLLPVVGATLGGAVVAAAIFLLDPQPWKALAFVGIFIVYQQIESHTVYPIVMGRTVKVGSFAVFLMALAGAELAGIMGALLAIPVGAALTVVVRAILEERRSRGAFEPTRTLEVVDRPDVSSGVDEPQERAGETLVDLRGQRLAVTGEHDAE